MLTNRVQPCFSAIHGARANSQACIDEARFAGFHDVMQCFKCLLDRRVMIETMYLVQIDIIHARPVQAVIDSGEDRLARQAGAIRSRAHPAVDLRGDHDLVAARESLIARPRISSLSPSE